MVSQENKLVGAFTLVGFGLFLVLANYTELGSEVVLAVMLGVGVLLPQLILQYTDYGDEP